MTLVLRLHLRCGIATGLGWRIVPGLDIGTTKDDEESIAHQINCGSNKEHNTPLLYIFLQKGKYIIKLVFSIKNKSKLKTYLIGNNESDKKWGNDAHNVAHAVCDAHQDSGKVWRQINMIYLEANITGAIETDSYS